MTATSPQPSPTKTDLSAIEDLTTLAAHLTQLGHTTHLITTSPPHLTLDYPGINVPQQIHLAPPPGFPDDGDWFCWHDPSRSCGLAPFTPRTTPAPQAAEGANRIMHVFVIACQLTRTQQPPPAPRGHLPACTLQASPPHSRCPGAGRDRGTGTPAAGGADTAPANPVRPCPGSPPPAHHTHPPAP